ncbi:aspartyl-phosphate phosphatase Spo0E family protein [Marinicrinis lubricantis]|uniref:Aspartyl-phosphate phosphatase Spo0E family protein n=1 Tax=Marinicrinis lubricantis TaxID=2086470 RepID=A0ABW1ILN5_9BACL
MEQAVNEQKSFTSEIVIQLSCMLDRKINEYMRIKRGRD